MEAGIVEEAILNTTREIWRSILGREAEVATPGSAFTLNEPKVTAWVNISGAWEGRIICECGMPVAVQIASIMFSIEGEPSKEDILDALKEIANITGGNLKTVLPEPCTLSSPEALDCINSSTNLEGHFEISKLLFEGLGGLISVSVLKKL